jgi:hypothetical protein
MKSCLKIVLVIGCVGLMISCHKDDPFPTQVLVNGSMDAASSSNPTAPANWAQSGPSTSWATEDYVSGDHSLKIFSPVANSPDFSYWSQTYSGKIPGSQDLVFSVKIKGKDLHGPGISLLINDDLHTSPSITPDQVASTQEVTFINGTFDWTTYSVKLVNVDPAAKSITVYILCFPGTTGTAYFDDATLVHY